MDCRSWARRAAAALLLLSTYATCAQAPELPPPQPLTLALAWAQATEYNKEILVQRQQVAVGAELVKDRRKVRLSRLPVVQRNLDYQALKESNIKQSVRRCRQRPC